VKQLVELHVHELRLVNLMCDRLLWRLIGVVVIAYLFLFQDPATTEIYTLSLHDALPILTGPPAASTASLASAALLTCSTVGYLRSEEHTSELQSQSNLVCRLLLEKKTASGSSSSTPPAGATTAAARGSSSRCARPARPTS